MPHAQYLVGVAAFNVQDRTRKTVEPDPPTEHVCRSSRTQAISLHTFLSLGLAARNDRGLEMLTQREVHGDGAHGSILAGRT